MARNSKAWEVRQQSIIVSFIATLLFGLAGCASATYTMPTPIEDQPEFSVTVPQDVDATWTAVAKLLAQPEYRVTRSSKGQGTIAFTVVDGPFADARYSYKGYIDCGHFDATSRGRVKKFNGPYIDFLMSVHSAKVTVLNTVLIEASAPLETNVSVRSEYDISIPKWPEYYFSFRSGGHARVQTARAIAGSDPVRVCQPTHYLERTFLEHVEKVVALTQSPELPQVVAAPTELSVDLPQVTENKEPALGFTSPAESVRPEYDTGAPSQGDRTRCNTIKDGAERLKCYDLASNHAVDGVAPTPAEDRIRLTILQTLRDPESARWGRFSAFPSAYCIEVNAKNAFGGYVGMQTFLVVSSGGELIPDPIINDEFFELTNTTPWEFCEDMAADWAHDRQ